MSVSESLEGCEWVSRTLFISFCCPHHFVGSSLQSWNSLIYRWLQGTGNIKDVVYLYICYHDIYYWWNSIPLPLAGLVLWEVDGKLLTENMGQETFKVLETTTTSTSWVSMPKPPTTGAPFPRLCWLSYRSTASEVRHCDTLAFWNQSLGDLRNHREKGHIHLDSGIHLILLFSCLYIGTTPHAVTVATRIIQFLVGNPYKNSFVTVTGSGVDQILESLTDFIGDESLL